MDLPDWLADLPLEANLDEMQAFLIAKFVREPELRARIAREQPDVLAAIEAEDLEAFGVFFVELLEAAVGDDDQPVAAPAAAPLSSAPAPAPGAGASSGERRRCGGSRGGSRRSSTDLGAARTSSEERALLGAAAAPAAERPTLSLTDKEKRLSALRNPADWPERRAAGARRAAHLAVERVDQGDDPSAPGAAREMRRSQTAGRRSLLATPSETRTRHRPPPRRRRLPPGVCVVRAARALDQEPRPRAGARARAGRSRRRARARGGGALAATSGEGGGGGGGAAGGVRGGRRGGRRHLWRRPPSVAQPVGGAGGRGGGRQAGARPPTPIEK